MIGGISQIVWRPVGDFTPLTGRRLMIVTSPPPPDPDAPPWPPPPQPRVVPATYDLESKTYAAVFDDDVPEGWAVTHWADWPVPPQ